MAQRKLSVFTHHERRPLKPQIVGAKTASSPHAGRVEIDRATVHLDQLALLCLSNGSVNPKRHFDGRWRRFVFLQLGLRVVDESEDVVGSHFSLVPGRMSCVDGAKRICCVANDKDVVIVGQSERAIHSGHAGIG